MEFVYNQMMINFCPMMFNDRRQRFSRAIIDAASSPLHTWYIAYPLFFLKIQEFCQFDETLRTNNQILANESSDSRTRIFLVL